MAHILVTGGAGYIGSHSVVALHAAGHEVSIVDDLRRSDRRIVDGIGELTGSRPRLFEVDVADPAALEAAWKAAHASAPVDAVVHFAAYKSVRESVADPLAYYANNVGGTVSLLRTMADSGCTRLVFSSSCTVYGQPDVLPVTEATPQRPAASPYGATKQMCEQLLHDVVASGAPGALTHVVSLRYFNPAGAHPSALIGELPVGVPENLVPFITQTAAGWRPLVRVFGDDYATPDGTPIRDYLHVLDLADAHVAAVADVLRSDPGLTPVNLGAGRGVSVLEALSSFERATGVHVPSEIAPRRPGDVEQIWSSCAFAEERLGWRATRSMDDIMGSAWAWQQTLGPTAPDA